MRISSTCHPHLAARRARGLTLVEAMIFVVIMGAVSAGFGLALTTSSRTSSGVDRRLNIHTRLVEKMEDLSSLDFATLSANSGLSDTVAVGNATVNRTVSVATCDANGDGTADSDFIEVTVTIENQSLKKRVAKP